MVLDAPEPTLDLGDASLPGALPGAAPGEPPEWLEVRPYNPEKRREDVRARVTFFLLWVLCAVVGAVLISVWVAWITSPTPEKQLSDLKDLASILINPLVVLLGTAIGFYFGAQRREGGGGPGFR